MDRFALFAAAVTYATTVVGLWLFYATLGVDYLRANIAVMGLLSEFAFVGLLPFLLALAHGDGRGTFGMTVKGLRMSLALGLLLVAVETVLRLLARRPLLDPSRNPAFWESFNYPLPHGLLLGLLNGLAYGPLEVFYVVFLAVNLDKALGGYEDGALSKGVVVASTIFGLAHLLNIPFQGVRVAFINSVGNMVLWLFRGIIFRRTGCSLGVMVEWSISNLT